MLGLVVLGSRTWMCTIAAPALAASRQELAICSGVTGTAGFLPGVSAEPVTAQEIITFRAMPTSLKAPRLFSASGADERCTALRGTASAPPSWLPEIGCQELAADA